MGYKVALDIGISSVGWAVVDEKMNILDTGTRLFDAADTSRNFERRANRGRKRLSRRKSNRLESFDKFWQLQNLITPEIISNNPLQLRNNGLHNKLTEPEIYILLRNMLKHRGISYLDDAIDDKATGEYQEALSLNSKELSTKFPCEIQLERLNEFNKYHGENVFKPTNSEEYIYVSNVFTSKGYSSELYAILNKQSQFHSFIDEKFIENYMNIFSSKRPYYIGPGNTKSRTDYGIYTTKINPETGEFITDENLFEKLIGKCSVYCDELRASTASYTAQEFNMLNDLNNLKINNRKLTEKEKHKIVDAVLDKTSNTTVKRLKSIIELISNEKITSWSGFRIDSKEKELFHTFEIYKKMKSELNKYDIDISSYSRNELDEIAHILTINTDKEAIFNAFEKSILDLKEEQELFFIEFRKNNSSNFNKWHSFSLKIMNELINDLYSTPRNQMELLTDMGVFKTNIELFKEYESIPYKLVTEEIYNPVVHKSVTQSIKLLNKIIVDYGYPDDIIIEMARDKNEDDQKKRIKDFQGKNGKELKDIINKVSKEYAIEIKDSDFYNQKTLKTKLRLWDEQNYICPYSGKTIHVNDMLKQPELFEIDHIIPLSISFDDSRNNKVLVYKTENQIKGNLTPYMYLSALQRDWNYDNFKSFITRDIKKMSHRKKKNLLFEENITKQEVVKGFINRNLNDTRYASRIVLNTLQGYMKANEKDTKIKVINGSFTSQLRHKLALKKDRDESYAHHAIDAAIMCYSQMGLDSYKLNAKNVIDYETGELLDIDKYLEMTDDQKYKDLLFYNKMKQMKLNIKNAEKNVKYSFKVDKKTNRKLSNETIYGTRVKDDGTIQKISKIKDIYSKDGYEKFKKKLSITKGKDKLDSFLMFHNDKATFEQLLKIVNTYKDKENPFLAYKEDYGEPIRKYSKKRNGPFIKSLKYYDGEIGSHIDVSHKYGLEKGSKKVILDNLNPYRTDVYYRKSDKSYHLAGIKYANFKYIKGEYILDGESYKQVLVDEKILTEKQDYNKIQDYGFEFMFSLYKNDIILYEKNGGDYIERFLSRTMPKVKNYIETKPIYKNKFDKQNLVGLSKASKIVKINTDILGNRHYTIKEKFDLGLKLDK